MNIKKRIRILAIAGIFTLIAPFIASAREDAIPESEARLLAGVVLLEHLALGTPGTEDWQDLTLGEAALLEDSSGVPYAWELDVCRSGRPIGRVRIGGSGWVGSVGLTLGTTPRAFSIAEALAETAASFASEHPFSWVWNARPVALAGSKLSARIDHFDFWTWTWRTDLVDLFSATPIPIPIPEAPPGQASAVSYYWAIDEEHRLLNRIDYDFERATLEESGEQLYSYGIDPRMAEPMTRFEIQVASEVLMNASLGQQVLETVDTRRCRLIWQETPDYCASAVAQMIDHYHYGSVRHTQTQIRSLMDAYGFSQPGLQWWYAMKKYYVHHLAMSLSEYDPNIDFESTQEDAYLNLKKQIDDGWPACDGVVPAGGGGHARMVMGYHVYEHGPFTRYELGVYDPLPLTGGVFWELGWKEGMFGMMKVAPRYFVLNVRQ